MRYPNASNKRPFLFVFAFFLMLFSTFSYQAVEPAFAEHDNNYEEPSNKPKPAFEKSDVPLVIKDITFKLQEDGKEIVFIQANRYFEPNVFSINGEKPRVVIDIKNLNNFRKGPSRIAVNGKLIRQIRVHYHKASKKLRVVLDHYPSFNYNVTQVFFQEENLYAVMVERH